MNRDREQFGEARLEEMIAQSRDLSAEDTLARVEQALIEHRGSAPGEDDLTMIAIKMLDA